MQFVNKFPRALPLFGATLISVSLSACSSSDDPLVDVKTVDTDASFSADNNGQIAFDTSLEGSVLQIKSLVESRTEQVLVALNTAYSEGILVPERVDCLTEGFPAFSYYCGEDGVGQRLSDFGYPAFALSVAETENCRIALLNGDAQPACELTYSGAELDGEWFVKYSASADEADSAVTITISDGVVPEFIEFQEGNPVCEIDIENTESIVFNDSANCQFYVAQVLAILQTP